MLEIEWTKQIKKDLKKFQFQKEVILEFNEVIKILVSQKALPPKYRDHNLIGDWVNFRECHVKNDVLLIYKITDST